MSQNIMTLREWQAFVKNPTELIVQASEPNGSDGWNDFPIGMGWKYVSFYNKNNKIINGEHNKTVLCAVSEWTDSRRRGNNLINRKIILENLKRNSIQNNFIDGNIYFETLPNYKFVISPEGNGIDCHRHYEALLAGCIPIIEKNPLIEKKYEGCPILYTTSYEEINEEYLNKKYLEMLEQKFDFSRLSLSFYDKNQIDKIKYYGNFWVKRLSNINWYQ